MIPSLGKNKWVTWARNIVQRLSLTYMSKEAFDCCPWPSNDFSNKGNIPEVVGKGDYHAFFNNGYFSSRCHGRSLFVFDAEFEYPDRLTIGKLKRTNY